MRVCLVLVISLFLLTGCGDNQKRFNEFQKSEVLRNETNIRTILNHLGYKDFKVIIIPHLTYSSLRKSSKNSIEDFKGDSWIPDSPPGLDVKKNEKLNDATEYYKRESEINYAAGNGQYNYSLDYLSALVLFESISEIEKNKITKIIEKIILNLDRGDTLEIVSLK